MKLVITEKASVAMAIAQALGIGKRCNGFLKGGGYAVSWCVGHLVEPAAPEAYGEAYRHWSYGTLPIIPSKWKYAVKKDTKAQFNVLKSLMNDADVEEVICATDAGREGELIFRLVYEQAGCSKPVRRLWISSMEESAIREGFDSLRPGSDYDNLYHSALCRQRADWLVGMNGTRLFTSLYKSRVLKVGRVQTPTLAMLVEREEKIMNFKKEPYYTAHIRMDGVDAATRRMDNKQEAEEIAGDCRKGQALVTAVTKEEKAVQPPKLYDLTTLQRDANRLFGFTAKQTLEYTQSLYEKKLATYPRTDSQYLSDDMEDTARGVIGAVYRATFFEGHPGAEPDIRRVMDSKKVTDHHAIIPTMEIAKADLSAVPEGERKILSLIANRLLCATGEKHIYETVKAVFSCNGHSFAVSGKSVTHNGWKDFEDAFKRSFRIAADREDENFEKKLPELSEGQTFDGVQAGVTEHFTSPPKRFTEDLLLASMERAGAEDMGDEVERKGLGTPATRADIIEKLVRDGFVRREKKQIVPTDDGIRLITVLPDAVKSPKLTADWENALALVAKGEYSAGRFMDGIEKMVSDLVRTYHRVREEEKNMFGSEAAIGKCPKCGGDVIKGKFGAYCSEKCGMNVGRAFGKELTEEQVRDLLEGKKILLKGLKSKKGSTYAAYLTPDGVEPYSYAKKDGAKADGFQFKFIMEFPGKEGR